jgi:hypothetical protein
LIGAVIASRFIDAPAALGGQELQFEQLGSINRNVLSLKRS